MTPRQTLFDVAGGAVIPILLLIFDPAVFRSTGCIGSPVLVNYAIFAYLAIGLGILTLLAWLFVPAARRRRAGIFAGTLLTGGLFAAGIGIVMLPVSIPGLLICLGALGFVPFITAVVYFRNGVRAFRTARLATSSQARLIVNLLVGSLLVMVPPAIVQIQITNAVQRAVDQIAENPGSSATVVTELRALDSMCLRLCTSTIGAAFDRAQFANPSRQQRLTETYREVTGQVLFSTYSCNSSSE